MTEAKKRPVPMIAPNRVQTADAARNTWIVTAESAEHPEDFLNPDYWGNVAGNFRPMDLVEIRVDDQTYWAELLVAACDKNWAQMHPLREVKLQALGEQPTDDRFAVQWKGPHRKWCVLRDADKSIIHEGDQSRQDAMTWLTDYVRNIGKKAA